MIVACVAAAIFAGVSLGASGHALLGKAAFLKVGNAICARGTRAIDQAGRKFFKTPGKPTVSEIVVFAKKVIVPADLLMLKQLRALAPPPADRAKVKALLDAAQQAVERVKANPRLLARPGASDPGAKANRLARAYGLVACAQ